MIIKLLADNTIFAQGRETINSTHSQKATTALMRELADALPYKGASVTKELVAASLAEFLLIEDATKRAEAVALYNYELVEGNISSKNGSPFYEEEAAFTPVSFDTRDALIRVSGKKFAPGDDVTGESADVQTFCNVIWAHDNGLVGERRQLLEDTEERPLTITKNRPTTVVEIVGGKAVSRAFSESYEEEVTESFPIEDENGAPVMSEAETDIVTDTAVDEFGVETVIETEIILTPSVQMIHTQPKMRQIPPAKITRLATVQDKIAAL